MPNTKRTESNKRRSIKSPHAAVCLLRLLIRLECVWAWRPLDAIDLSECDAVDLSECDAVDLSECDAVDLSECDAIDLSECDAIELSECDAIDLSECDAVDLSECDAVDLSECDAVQRHPTLRSVVRGRGSMLLFTFFGDQWYPSPYF
jgi:hypothetical protein